VNLGKKYPYNTNTKSWSPTPNQTWTYNFQFPFIEGQITGDELHKPPFLEGGPFKSLRCERIFPYEIQGLGTYLRQSDSNPALWEKYVGGFAPPAQSTIGGVDMSNMATLLNLNSSLFPDITAYGDRAWKSTKPKLERASAFVFVAELRDLPHMLKQTAKRFSDIWNAMGGQTINGMMHPKRLADDFLNEQFGWVPFLADLRAFYAAYHGSANYLKHFTATNGKPTRRRVTLVGAPYEDVDPVTRRPIIRWEPEYAESQVASGLGSIIEPVLNANFFSVQPSWTVTEVIKSKVTATGKFTFYRPEFDTGLSEYNSAWFAIQRHLTMYGLRISPSNVYRATPWTWLIDWFINVGKYFDLLTDILVDSIACQYLYLHESKETIRVFRQIYPFTYPGPTDLTWTKTVHSKERAGASSPYGFSLTWDNLTPRQLAILGALGLSRSKF
jgi:hypothetical protein